MKSKQLFSVIVVLLFALTSNTMFAQTMTNLERLTSLVDSSSSKIVLAVQDTSSIYKLSNNTPSEYSILDNRVISGLSKSGMKISETGSNILAYTISNAGVEYTDLFRDGLFGDYLLERRFDLNGNFVITKLGRSIKSDTFDLTLTDTINYDNLASVENHSLPFTKAIPPSEPFIPSIIEPVIAITAVAVTVILFFSVRSK